MNYVKELKEWLGESGISYFREIRDEHGGKLAVVIPGEVFPHSVHFNEGMQIRNFIRQLHQDGVYTHECPDAHWLDDNWEQLTLEAIE